MSDEKIFTIPLRKAWRSPRTKRASKAIIIIREFLQRHMKSDEVKIGDSINKSVWARGIQNPPRRIRIHATKEENIIYSEILEKPLRPATKEEVDEKKAKKEAKKEKIKEDRKERKKMSMKEEIESEEGKTVDVKDRPSEVPDIEPKDNEKAQEVSKEDRKL